MKPKNVEEALSRALTTWRKARHQLAQGVEEAHFQHEYRGSCVSPGVTVRQYVEQLRISGDIEETGTQIRLKQKRSAVAA